MPSQDENDAEFKEIFDQFKDANENDDKEGAAEAVARVWEHLGKQESEPSPWLVAVQMAHGYEALHDWDEAERAYRGSIAVSSDNRGSQCQSLGYLSSLFTLLGNNERALDAAIEAVVLARTFEFPMLLIQALGRECAFRLQQDELATARELLREQLELIATQPVAMNSYYLGAIVRRAALNIKSGDLEAAHADLEEIWPALEAKREWTIFVAYQSSLAAWWETKSALFAAHHDTEGEIEALREAVHYREVVSQAPQLEGPYKFDHLAQAWLKLAKVLRAAGSPEADDGFEKSAQIRRAIGLPPLD